MSHKPSALFLPDTLVAVVSGNPDKAIRKARSFSYPKQVLYLIATFIALISLCHFLSLFITRSRVYGWKRRSTMSLPRFPAAAVDCLRTLAFRWTVPVGSSHDLTFAEVGLTLGYMVVLFSWTFINTTATTEVKFDPRYYANRAGRIAASQLPIMVALGMKNNIISWLTGISFIKLNYLHRASARVLCLLIWIHAGGRIQIGFRGDNALVNRWIHCGFLAGSTLTLLCFLTIRPIRERNYEAFLFVHFILAFIFMLSVYFHLVGSSLGYYGAWPSMIVWGVDYFIRFIRLAIINFGYLNPWSSQNSKKELDAVVEVLSPHYLRATLHRSRYLRWRPGQNAYLTFPSVSTLPFESHPFTISTIDNDSTSGDSILVFLLRVRTGFTQKLLQEASPDQTHKVFLNGPYGSPPILIGYQTVILIAGGSGVTFTLPFILDILRRARTGKNTCQKVLFIWAIRDSNHIHWIANTLAPTLENVPPSISVAVQLYITGATATDESEKCDESSKENGSGLVVTNENQSSTQSYSTILKSPFVQIHQQRPDIQSLISKEVDEATSKISISVCGTHSLANAVRTAIRLPRPMDILRGGPTITLHVETFGTS